MKALNYIAVMVWTVVGMGISGCSADYLDTTPTNQVSAGEVYGSVDNLYAALNGIHRKMVSQDLSNQGMGGEPGFIIAREAMGDDMTWDTQTWHQGYLNWSYNTNASSQYNYGIWETYYKFILNANIILENLQKLENLSADDETLAQHIRGEALCIRAWAHFQLVQYYAKPYINGQENTQPGIPYRETSEALTQIARTPVEDVYAGINADLSEAADLLNGYTATDINHYTEKVVLGLQARVALTQQRYAEAAEYARQAIETATEEGLSIMTPEELTNGFADISSETNEAMYAALTQDDQTVYFYSFYAYMSWNFNSSSIRTGIKCINQATYDKMGPNDYRRQWWDPTGTAEVPSSSYNQRVYQNRKFTARSTSDAVGDYAFMRLSEMYLIAAEAYARAGNESAAKTYLDAFVAQRDPDMTGCDLSGDALIDAIMQHRRIELWGEGFRWFDLKRLQEPIHRDGSNFNVTFCGFLDKEVDEDGWIFEIPQDETDYNPLMEKNY